MNKPKRSAVSAIISGLVTGLLFATSLAAQAQTTGVPVRQGAASDYMNGGVDDGQVQAMRSVAADWPLHITFSQLLANEYVSGVSLTILNSLGETVLELNSAGPLTYVRLPEGRYRVTAKFINLTQSRDIRISGNNSRDLHFHWKGKVQLDPFDGSPMGGKQVPG